MRVHSLFFVTHKHLKSLHYSLKRKKKRNNITISHAFKWRTCPFPCDVTEATSRPVLKDGVAPAYASGSILSQPVIIELQAVSSDDKTILIFSRIGYTIINCVLFFRNNYERLRKNTRSQYTYRDSIV
ncbi:hypothetical protein C0J52_11540 [Blattella germanica]|nr:hypothetical protein C0J52_11540 [Blattella germanica]